MRAELASLERRRHLASWSINCCTGAALLACTVIVTLFIEEFLGTPLRWLAGAQFVATMVSVISEPGSFSGVLEQRAKTRLMEAQSAAIARAMASIGNEEQARFGVMSGHDRKTLRLSGLSCFLAEVYIATRASHIDARSFGG